MNILNTLAKFFLEIFFDHKEEYTFTSAKFNLKKVLILVTLTVSVSMNTFLTYNFFNLGLRYIELKENHKKLQSKINKEMPSDSQNPPME